MVTDQVREQHRILQNERVACETIAEEIHAQTIQTSRRDPMGRCQMDMVHTAAIARARLEDSGKAC